MRKILCLVLLMMPLILPAQDSLSVMLFTSAQIDSLMQAREQEVTTEYGFKPSDTLLEVAERLDLKNDKIGEWKEILGLEAKNVNLDNMSLSALGITPYKAFLAHQKAIRQFDETSTLSDISKTFSIPIHKLKTMLGFKGDNQDHYSIQLLGKTTDDIENAIQEYQDHVQGFGWSVTLIGMLVVFSALIITSFFIGQLVHLNREKKTKEDKAKPAPTAKASEVAKVLDHGALVAAITALHLHRMDMEERRKLALTFRRTPTNQWRASAVLSMPNREMNSYRRNK